MKPRFEIREESRKWWLYDFEQMKRARFSGYASAKAAHELLTINIEWVSKMIWEPFEHVPALA